MLVKDIMTTNVITVKPDTLVTEVAKILHTQNITGVPVVSDDGTVLGVISEHDFITAENLYLPTYITLISSIDYVQGANKELPHVVDQIVRSKAADIMNKHAPFAGPDMTIEDLADLFTQGFSPVPVTNPSNKLVGVVSRSDLIKLVITKTKVSLSKPESHEVRMIDEQVKFTSRQFESKFAYVAKARANIWLTAIVVLFVIGFLAGIIYVADPSIFVKEESILQH